MIRSAACPFKAGHPRGTLLRIALLNDVGIGFFMTSDVREDVVAGQLVRVLAEWTP
jgi:DNA-binding transcriptional LysR family regulator